MLSFRAASRIVVHGGTKIACPSISSWTNRRKICHSLACGLFFPKTHTSRAATAKNVLIHLRAKVPENRFDWRRRDLPESANGGHAQGVREVLHHSVVTLLVPASGPALQYLNQFP